MEWKNVYRGFIIGIANLIPGVSGGTMAVILGVYEQLLEAISGFFSKEWKKQLGFLLPLGAGMVLALLSLSRLIDFLLQNYYQPTQFFFMGLIIGTIPLLVKQADPKTNFSSRHWVALVLAALLVAAMAFINPSKSSEPIISLNILTIIRCFFSGWMASLAMLLPGISGSFILILLGVYSTAIYALSTLDLPLLIIIGAGVIAGFALSSKGISYVLARYPHMTYGVILGLLIGSVIAVFPGFSTHMLIIVMSVISFGAGLVLASLFGSR
jgi:putative membrane protein